MYFKMLKYAKLKLIKHCKNRKNHNRCIYYTCGVFFKSKISKCQDSFYDNVVGQGDKKYFVGQTSIYLD